MKITILSTAESSHYAIADIDNITNDEISRAIAYLELIKLELLNWIEHDYEVTEG